MHLLPDYISKVGEFHAKFGLDGVELPQPGFPSDEIMGFRLNFGLEELVETAAAAGFSLKVEKDGEVHFVRDEKLKQNLAETLDGMVDQQYVLAGTVRHFGFGTPRFDPELSQHVLVFNSAFLRVHGANMKKVRAANAKDSKRTSPFDVVKPEGWKPADLTDLISAGK